MTPLRGVRAAEDRARRRDRICPVERRPTAQTTARGKIFAAGEIPVCISQIPNLATVNQNANNEEEFLRAKGFPLDELLVDLQVVHV